MGKNPTEYMIAYYNKHKGKWNEKVKCDVCNKYVSKSNLNKHNKTKKHIIKTEHKNKTE